MQTEYASLSLSSVFQKLRGFVKFLFTCSCIVYHIPHCFFLLLPHEHDEYCACMFLVHPDCIFSFFSFFMHSASVYGAVQIKYNGYKIWGELRSRIDTGVKGRLQIPYFFGLLLRYVWSLRDDMAFRVYFLSRQSFHFFLVCFLSSASLLFFLSKLFFSLSFLHKMRVCSRSYTF